MNFAPAAPSLDDISKRIVELLPEDSHRPYAEIGRGLGHTESLLCAGLYQDLYNWGTC